MDNLRETSRIQKFLKATQVASYHSDIAYGGVRWRSRPFAQVRQFWNAFRKEAKYYLSEYVVSNAFVMSLLAKANGRSVAVTTPLSPVSRAQFAFNWLCAMLSLLLTLPLIGLIGLAIRIDSPGPILYRQERVGINRRKGERRQSPDSLLDCRRMGRERRRQNLFGKPFLVYKFRTMVVDAEKRCGPIWATKNDPRVTRVGRWLRKTRLDELPQLLNVLKGEMSLVGPRPERPFFIAKLTKQIDCYERRLEVLPGITGLAQVERGYDASVDDVRAKVDCDLQYIASASIKKDLTIMLKTITVVLGCRGM